METRAFAPLYQITHGATAGVLVRSVTVAGLTTAVASGELPDGSNQGSSDQQYQIANTTPFWAYVNFGVYGNVTAATAASSYPVAPGSVVVVSVSPEIDGASVILVGGTGNVIFTTGEGI